MPRGWATLTALGRDGAKRTRPYLNLLTKKAPYKGLGADSEEKHEPVSDIDTAVVLVGLKALYPEWPIREADMTPQQKRPAGFECARRPYCTI